MAHAIKPSARKHGIADEDILHAIEHALVWLRRGNRYLYPGPDRATNMLEVISLIEDDLTEIVIHAMRMRGRYKPTLRGHGDPDA